MDCPARRSARDVEHERGAIGEGDICVPALEIKCPTVRGHAAVGVTRGIANDICFGLDDAAAGSAFRQFSHEHFADEKTSEPSGIDRQFCPIHRNREARLALANAVAEVHSTFENIRQDRKKCIQPSRASVIIFGPLGT
jgi:hypothetical protein